MAVIVSDVYIAPQYNILYLSNVFFSLLRSRGGVMGMWEFPKDLNVELII